MTYKASVFFFVKQKTAYEMRISDWSSDVCSSDLLLLQARFARTIDGPTTPAGVQIKTCTRCEERMNDNNNKSATEIVVSPSGDSVANTEIGRASCRARVCQYV